MIKKNVKMSSFFYLEIWWWHVPVPHLVVRVRGSLVEGALQLLGETLCVLTTLVLGHTEQDSGGIRGCGEEKNQNQN